MRGRRLVAGVVVAGVAVLGACGVRSQDEPVRVERDRVPFGLLDSTTTTTTTTTDRPVVPGIDPGAATGG